MKKFLSIALFGSLFIVGCSSGPSEEDLKITVLEYSLASFQKDWSGVCASISAESKQSVIDNSGQLSCEAGYRALSPKDQQTLSDSAKDTNFVSATINEDRAVALVKTARGTAKVPLIVEDGSWKVHLFK